MGHASVVAPVLAGLFFVDANYFGDGHFNQSSGTVPMHVSKAATSITLTISPNPATPGATIAYSAIVNILPPGNIDPEGSLQFFIDDVPIGAAIGLGGGAIGFRGSLIAPPSSQTYQVVVTYSGDDNTEPSSSSVAVTIAAPAAPSTAPSSAPQPVATVSVARLNSMMSTLATALRLRGFAALTSTTQTLRAGPGVVDQKVYSPSAPRGTTQPRTRSRSCSPLAATASPALEPGRCASSSQAPAGVRSATPSR